MSATNQSPRRVDVLNDDVHAGVQELPPPHATAPAESLEEVIAAKPTASFDAQVPQSAQTTERFIGWMYAEVKAAQR